MATVGEATIKLNFDGKSLEASMDKTEQVMETKGGLLGKLGGEKAAAAWGVGIGLIAGITQTVVNQALDIITSGIDSAIKRLDTMNNFPRVMENLGISADKSKKVIDDLSQRLKGLPTTLDAAALAVQRFTSANKDVEKSEEYFLALNNALLAGGASADLQASALEQLSQAYAKGKPDMMEWRSLLQAMPAQLNQVAEAMDYKTTEKLGEALRSGAVSMDEFMDTLVTLNKKGSKNYKSFEKQAKAATGGIQTAQANLNTAVTRGWTKILDSIGSKKITQALGKVGNAFEQLLSILGDLLGFIANNEVAIAALKATLLLIAGVITAVVVPAFVAWTAAILANPITWIIAGVVSLITALILLKDHIKEVGQWFKNVFSSITSALNAFGSRVGQVVNNFKNAFSSAFTSVKNWFLGVFNYFSQIASKISTLFKNIGTKVGNMVSGAFKGVVNAVIAACENFLNTPIRGINRLLDVINAVPGVHVDKLPTLRFPRMAKGGLVTESILANVGEAGKEAVIPLERNTENWARPLASAIADQFQQQGIGGSGITVYMTNNINNNLDADEIGRRLMTSIRRAA